MSDFDDLMAEADGLIAETLGKPCTYLSGDTEISTHVVIDRDVHVLGGDGYTTVNQDHAGLPALPFQWKRGDEIRLKSGDCYRVHGRVQQDASWLVLLVSPVSEHDLQRIQESSASLHQTVQEVSNGN
ncbi:MAG: hypothetical protein OIF55_14660 [Amphritea sp.]|nr:hypothetical protein [Amphritea sp.]